MKQQKLIITNDQVYWEKVVNGYLKDGWEVVPSTLQVKMRSFYSRNPAEVYVVVIEKEGV